MSETATVIPVWSAPVAEIITQYAAGTPEDRQAARESMGDRWGADAVAHADAQWAEADFKARVQAQIRAKMVKPQPAPPPTVVKASRSKEVAAAAKPKLNIAVESSEDRSGPVLNPKAPYDIAGTYIHNHCMLHADCTLWHWQDQFYRWAGQIYEVVPEHVMRGQIWAFLDKAQKRSGDAGFVRFQPEARVVNEVIDSLKSRLSLGTHCQPPMWLADDDSDDTPATDWVVFQNKVVNVLTEEARDLSPKLWVHSALGFNWDPEALCPRWMSFLGEIFPGKGEDGVDHESIDFLEEWMGYCMTEETKFQKAALLIGQRRSGKSTIGHVIRNLVGNPAYVGLSFNTWISSENSKEAMLGKKVGCFADVRFKPGKSYGMNYDAGGITHQSAEFLLNITGRDSVTIGRKYKAAWQGQLKIKMMLISNEVPNLNDTAGVLPSRFIKLHFPVSFYGREEVDLSERLDRELPGIALRCIRAYAELCDRGFFIQPKSARVLDQEVTRASDPMTAMVEGCFRPDYSGTVARAVVLNSARTFMENIARPDMLAKVTEKSIRRIIMNVAGYEHLGDAPRAHGTPRAYSGISLRSQEERKSAAGVD